VKNRWDWLTSQLVDAGDATRVLEKLGKGWYAFAAIITVVGLVLIFIAQGSWAFIGDALLCAAAGYCLPRYKSRAFAVFLFIYSVAVGILTIATRLGQYKGMGQNIVLAMFLILTGYRGVVATFVYHKNLGTRIQRRNTAIAVGACLLMAVLSFTALVMVLVIQKLSGTAMLSDDAVAYSWMAGTVIGCILVLVILNRRIPFVVTKASDEGEANRMELPIEPA